METAWILDDMYYCDDVGVMVTGWKKLTPPEEYQDEDKHTGPFETASDGQYWYYFGTNWKTVPSENRRAISRNRKDQRNLLLPCAEDGAVQTKFWVCVTGDESDNIEGLPPGRCEGKSPPPGILPSRPEYLAEHCDSLDVRWFISNSKGCCSGSGTGKGQCENQ